MFLQEEYSKRHKLNKPIINYVTHGSVLLKTEVSYMLMSINWEDHSRRPGKFNISFFTPVHNGYVNAIFFRMMPEIGKNLQWDEYADYLTNFRENTVIDEKEVGLAIWAMFVYGCDYWFAQHEENALYQSLDESLPLEKRFFAYQEMVHKLQPEILRLYQDEMLSSFKNYCYWMGK